MLMKADQLGSLENVGDVPLTIRAELDRKQISVRELLDLQKDSVVLLSRPAGENVDLYASEVYMGSGEILVIGGGLAIRLADIASESARTSENPASNV